MWSNANVVLDRGSRNLSSSSRADETLAAALMIDFTYHDYRARHKIVSFAYLVVVIRNIDGYELFKIVLLQYGKAFLLEQFIVGDDGTDVYRCQDITFKCTRSPYR